MDKIDRQWAPQARSAISSGLWTLWVEYLAAPSRVKE